MPGNHDVPLYRVAERIFSPYALYRTYISEKLDTVLRRDDAVIVGLNSTSPLRAIVNGRIDRRQLDFCADAFASAPEGAARIVVAHHHFAPAPDYEGDKPMPKAKRALDRFTEMRVDLILGGHLHRAYIGNSLDVYPGEDREHGIIIVQSGTTTSRRGRAREREKNSFNLIRIGEDTIRVTHYMYFDEAGGFEPVSQHIFPRAGGTISGVRRTPRLIQRRSPRLGRGEEAEAVREVMAGGSAILGWLLLLLLAPAASLEAQVRDNGDGQELVEIRFEGATSFGEGQLRAAIVSRETRCRNPAFFIGCWFGFGMDPFYLDNGLLSADALRLWRFSSSAATGRRVSNVETEPADDGYRAVFRVHEGQPVRVARIEVEGTAGVVEPEIAERLPLRLGQPLSEIALDASRDSLVQAFRNRGYPARRGPGQLVRTDGYAVRGGRPLRGRPRHARLLRRDRDRGQRQCGYDDRPEDAQLPVGRCLQPGRPDPQPEQSFQPGGLQPRVDPADPGRGRRQRGPGSRPRQRGEHPSREVGRAG